MLRRGASSEALEGGDQGEGVSPMYNGGGGTSQYREDASNSGQSRFAGPGASRNATRWDVHSSGGTAGIKSTVSMDETSLYYGSLDGNVYSRSRATGEVQWTFETSGSITASVTLFDFSTAFAASSDSFLYALSSATGSLLWRSAPADSDGAIFASPVAVAAATTTLVLVVSGKSIRALSTDNGGARVWLTSLSGLASQQGSYALQSTPAVDLASQRVFLTTGLGKHVLALDLGSGAILWSQTISASVLSSPCLQLYKHGAGLAPTLRVYVAAGDGVHALGALRGRLLWHFAGQGGYSSVAASNDSTLVFFGSTDGSIYGISAMDGAEVWAFPTGGPIRLSSPVLDRAGTLYLGSSDGTLYAVNSSTGQPNWHLDTNAATAASASAANSTSGGASGSGGGGSSSVPVGAASISASPAIGSDGTVFIGNSLGALFAIGASVAPGPAPGPGQGPAPGPGPGPWLAPPGSPTPFPTAQAIIGGQSSGSATQSISAGNLAAAVICSVLGLALLVGGAVWLVRRHKSSGETRERSGTAAALEMARQQQQRHAAR